MTDEELDGLVKRAILDTINQVMDELRERADRERLLYGSPSTGLLGAMCTVASLWDKKGPALLTTIVQDHKATI